MLGKTLSDPEGMEGRAETVQGLGLLDMETSMTSEKSLLEVRDAHLGNADGDPWI